MQNVPGLQGPHGELTELNVTGAQVLAAVVAAMFALSLESLTVATGHGAGNAAAGSITAMLSSLSAAESVAAIPADGAVRPEPPVSNTFVSPSDTRVKVNFGQTCSVESNVLEFIVIVPPEAL